MRRLALLLLAGLVLAPTALAAAPKSPVFGLRGVGNPKRGYFVYTLARGGTKQGAVIVSNSGTAAGTVKLFAADATTGATTGTVYETDKAPKAAGAWIKLAGSSFTLKPGAHKRVAFTVRVPAGAPAGQWVAGLVAETSHQVSGQKSSGKANVQIRVRDLTIIAVQVNIPGPPIVSFKIGAIKTGGQRGFQQLLIHIENTGNVLVKPHGTVTIYDAKGQVLQTLTFTMDTFLPHTTIDYPVLLKKALPAGNYSAAVSLDAGAGKVTRSHPQFAVSREDVAKVFTSASPTQAPPGSSASSGTGSSTTSWLIPAIAAAAALALLGGGLLFWSSRRRRRRREPTTLLRSASAAATAPAATAPTPEPPSAPTPVVPAAPEIQAPPAPRPFPAPPSPPPAEPAPEPVSAPEPARTGPDPCDPFHYWEVAYDRGQLGGDGVWRFPHRCRTCGLELLAQDISDASAQAEARRAGR